MGFIGVFVTPIPGDFGPTGFMASPIPQRGLQPNWTSKNICIALSKTWQKVLLLAEDHWSGKKGEKSGGRWVGLGMKS